ncbi:MAG: ankyrin repeat domain-containing protein [Promethearchaeia archaeon]
MAHALNPLVGTGGVRRVHATKLNRGATPPVLIQNPAVPFFDPYNHDFSNSNAVADCQAGTSFAGGWTALHAAAGATLAGPHGKEREVKGDLDEMRFLLAGRGHHVPPEISFPHTSSPQVDVNAAMTKSKYTPLHVAVRSGHIEALELLLEHSALCDAADSLGRTPLHHAAELGHADCLGQLLDAGSAGELGLLKVRVIGADLVTVNGEEFSPRHRQGMELWVEVEVEQRPPIVHPTLKTSVQVDVDNLHWNNTLTFRCCHRDAKVTLRLMYRHAGLTKKEKDLILGSFSCTLPAALAVAGPDRAQRDEPAVVVLESFNKTKERERREAQRAARGAQARAGGDFGRAGSSDRLERRSSGSAFHRKKSGASTTSDSDRKSGRDDRVKTGLKLRGAVGAVIAANRLARSQEMDEEDEDGDTITMTAEFHPLINVRDVTGRSALMLGSLSVLLLAASHSLTRCCNPVVPCIMLVTRRPATSHPRETHVECAQARRLGRCHAWSCCCVQPPTRP